MRGVLDTPSGCGFSCRRIPGVREKRVPLADFLPPLRGALIRLWRPQKALSLHPAARTLLFFTPAVAFEGGDIWLI